MTNTDAKTEYGQYSGKQPAYEGPSKPNVVAETKAAYNRMPTPRDTWVLAKAIDKLGLSPTPAQIALLEKNKRPWEDKSTWTMEARDAAIANVFKLTIPLIVNLMGHVASSGLQDLSRPTIEAAGYDYNMAPVDGKREYVSTVVISHKDPDAIDKRNNTVIDKRKKIADDNFGSTWHMDDHRWGVQTVEEAIMLVYEEVLFLMEEYKCGPMTPFTFINSRLRRRLFDLWRATKGQRKMQSITVRLDNEETSEAYENVPDRRDPYAVIRTMDAILDAFGTLGKTTRSVIVLRGVDYEDDQIADRLDTTTDNVRKIRSRGTAAWKEAFKQRGGDKP